jgi:hypothetical protein
MAYQRKGARTGSDRSSLYQDITDKIIAQLEGRAYPMGPAMVFSQSIAGHAAQCRDRSSL